MFCLYFYFFKQKTAYEMRMSDWSADVCSSDLRTEAGDDRRQTRRQGPGRDFVLPSPPYASRGTAPALQIHRSEYRADSSRARRQAEIGRASCRARVGQYV